MTAKQRKAAKKSWIKIKGRKANKKAKITNKDSRKFTKWNLTRKDYKTISLDDWKGIVDLVAIKRDNRNPDNLQIILFQMKGGTARIKPEELKRLKAAKKKLDIRCGTAIKKGKPVDFKLLD